jgi:hypothetical protein
LGKRTKSDNEKVAEQLSKLVNNVTLDLDQVGEYIARSAPNVTYRRFMEIADAARYEREEEDFGNNFFY